MLRRVSAVVPESRHQYRRNHVPKTQTNKSMAVETNINTAENVTRAQKQTNINTANVAVDVETTRIDSVRD